MSCSAFRCIVFEKVDRLLARPALVVHAGIDDQSHGAPHVVGELTKTGVGVFIEAKVIPQTLAVQAPALHKCGKPHVAAEHSAIQPSSCCRRKLQSGDRA